MTRLDQNRAMAQLATKAGVPSSAVTDAIIWGNHSATQVPDYKNTKINGKSAEEAIGDLDWLQGEFFTTVQKRGAAIIAARGLSSAMSAANGLVDHVRDLRFGCDGIRSMCVPSDGSYGVTEGLISSFPVRCTGNNAYEIVQGLELDDFLRGRLAATVAELAGEKDVVADLLGANA
jgi:malate dehydrogenase